MVGSWIALLYDFTRFGIVPHTMPSSGEQVRRGHTKGYTSRSTRGRARCTMCKKKARQLLIGTAEGLCSTTRGCTEKSDYK